MEAMVGAVEQQPSDLLRTPTSLGASLYLVVLVGVWLVVAGTSLYAGMPYYQMSLQEKAYSDLHALYKPSGLVGHGYGIVGSLMMIVGVSLYTLRKRMARLSRFGKLKYWLQFHIFLCTLGPFLVLLHTSFKFGGIVSIAFWSMAVVVGSGVFGRYVYARIPKTLNGQFLAPASIERSKVAVASRIRGVAGLSAADAGALLETIGERTPESTLDALLLALRHDLTRRRKQKVLGQLLMQFDVPLAARGQVRTLVLEHIYLERQVARLHPFQKLFGYWHVFHLPLAVVMFLIMIVHIVVAALFGYAWIF